MKGLSWPARAGLVAVLLYACVLSVRPLNANDLFWHLATGREILHTGSIPHADLFSFASDRREWIDHEWLWQGAAQIIYGAAARGRGPMPDPGACAALIAAGALVVLGAFLLALRRLVVERVPAVWMIGLGLAAAEIARQRLMVRPETASLLFLAVVLTILGRGRPSLRGALLLAGTTAMWANVHPAALLVPGIVLVWGFCAAPFMRGAHPTLYPAQQGSIPLGQEAAGTAGGRACPLEAGHSSASSMRTWAAGVPQDRGVDEESQERGDDTRGERRGVPVTALSLVVALRPFVLTALLAAAATLVNPYGARLWTVPLALARMVKTRSYVNPEWLSPPLALFPVFYAAAAIVVVAVITALVRFRRVPEAPLLVAAGFSILAMSQMRHLGLFAVSLLFAGGALIRVFDANGTLTRALSGRALTVLAVAGTLAAAAPAAVENFASMREERGLDRGRFPVAACEQIDRHPPAVRLYNDVQFGGYLIWRFFPGRQVFIDGRNELYTELLPRIAAIHTGEAPYSEWRVIVREFDIEGAIVKYQDVRKGVIYPPARPGARPELGYRAWSAFLFPVSEWALVYFDDTALVFMRRGGRGEPWIQRGEFRDYNPEDRDYLLGRAQQDVAFAQRLRAEVTRRLSEDPPSRRAQQFLEDLDALTLPVNERQRSVSPRS